MDDLSGAQKRGLRIIEAMVSGETKVLMLREKVSVEEALDIAQQVFAPFITITLTRLEPSDFGEDPDPWRDDDDDCRRSATSCWPSGPPGSARPTASRSNGWPAGSSTATWSPPTGSRSSRSAPNGARSVRLGSWTSEGGSWRGSPTWPAGSSANPGSGEPAGTSAARSARRSSSRGCGARRQAWKMSWSRRPAASCGRTGLPHTLPSSNAPTGSSKISRSREWINARSVAERKRIIRAFLTDKSGGYTPTSDQIDALLQAAIEAPNMRRRTLGP